ncbi:enterochelin esterase [Tengunoibacter tsumagoiensis]|nr:enterochelin esterase [Tengunoibacter tsumagoiensis]
MSEKKEPLLSPVLRALQQAVAEEVDSALTSFWQEMTLQKTPLIEKSAEHAEHALVTFLWREREATKTVVVVSALGTTPLGWKYRDHQMSHLPHTDLWYRTYEVPNTMRMVYRLSPNDTLEEYSDELDWDARTATFQVDPLNPHTYVLSADEECDQNAEEYSVLELPDAPPQFWSDIRESVPRGNVELRRFHSAILNNERRIWIYTPPGYTKNTTPYGVLLVFDGLTYIHDIPMPTILDNLVADHLLQPMIAISICTLDWETRDRELTCYQPFVDFLADELLPWLRQEYHITTDPAQTIVGGSSYGGLAASFAALKRSDVFGNVLSQSGAVYWTPDDDPDFEWLTRQYVANDTLPVRFYLDVGLLENNPRRSTCPDGPTQLAATRHFRNVLRAKKYFVSYTEYSSGHDYVCWRGSLANGLLALLSL